MLDGTDTDTSLLLTLPVPDKVCLILLHESQQLSSVFFNFFYIWPEDAEKDGFPWG